MFSRHDGDDLALQRARRWIEFWREVLREREHEDLESEWVTLLYGIPAPPLAQLIVVDIYKDAVVSITSHSVSNSVVWIMVWEPLWRPIWIVLKGPLGWLALHALLGLFLLIFIVTKSCTQINEVSSISAYTRSRSSHLVDCVHTKKTFWWREGLRHTLISLGLQ